MVKIGFLFITVDPDAGPYLDVVTDLVRSTPSLRHVVLVARWQVYLADASYRDALVDTVQSLRDADLGVSVIGPLGIATAGRLAPPEHRTSAIARVAVIGFLGFFHPTRWRELSVDQKITRRIANVIVATQRNRPKSRKWYQ